MATVQEVREQAGEMLGFIRHGQGLPADKDAMLTRAYNQEYDMLDEYGLAVWASDGTVPDRVAPHLAAMIARNCGAPSSISNERWVRILALDNIALAKIQAAVTPAYESLDEPTDY